jgi:adenine-specific DNA-methyltransferase
MTGGLAFLNPARRRQLGQVCTPQAIAEWMVRWACVGEPRRILDPAVGPGVFIDAVERWWAGRSRQTVPRIEACDIDADVVRQLAKVRRRLPVHCREADFITADFQVGYDAIVANPPYVRHHAMEYGEDLLGRFDSLCGLRLSRRTNLYGLFLLKIWKLLAPGGRAAVITPAEWLNADFGVPLKTYLLRENAIDAIVHFDHAALVFDGILTTAAITLLKRGRADREPVRLLTVSDAEALGAVDLEAAVPVPASSLDPAAKWTSLFGRSLERARSHRVLGDIARCSRGIATGANDYFTLRESDRRRWGLELADLRLCITKAQDITDPILTRAHVRKLIRADRRIYLLSPRPRLPLAPDVKGLHPAVKRYLEEGRRRGIHRRYLPSHRPVWYLPEHREPAPILASVFARGPFRFVLNRAGVLNLTAYHGVYPRSSDRVAVDAVFEYLSSDAAQKALLDHRRIYADGLFKIEPGDLEALPVPDDLCRFPRR